MLRSYKQKQFFDLMLNPVVGKLGEDYRPKLLKVIDGGMNDGIDPIDTHHLLDLMSEVAFPKDREGHFKKSFDDYCLTIKDLQTEVDKQFSKFV